MEAVICIFSTKKEAQSTRKGPKGCKGHILVKFFFHSNLSTLLNVDQNSIQDQSKQKQREPKQTLLGGRIQTFKKTSTLLRLLHICGSPTAMVIFLGAGARNIGGARAHPGPPLATPLDLITVEDCVQLDIRTMCVERGHRASALL